MSKNNHLSDDQYKHKFMLISAKVNGHHQHLVAVGSHNMTGNSLYYNDDTFLVLKDENLYENYRRYWEHMLNQSQKHIEEN